MFLFFNFSFFIDLVFLLGNKDAAALFLCHKWVCSAANFADTIIDLWRKWEKGGFPIIGIAHTEMISRYLIILIFFLMDSYSNRCFFLV